jgi:hypothetical protein
MTTRATTAVVAVPASGRDIFLATARRRGWAVNIATDSGAIAARIVTAARAEVCHYCGFDPEPRQGLDCGMCGGN